MNRLIHATFGLALALNPGSKVLQRRAQVDFVHTSLAVRFEFEPHLHLQLFATREFEVNHLHGLGDSLLTLRRQESVGGLTHLQFHMLQKGRQGVRKENKKQSEQLDGKSTFARALTGYIPWPWRPGTSSPQAAQEWRLKSEPSR